MSKLSAESILIEKVRRFFKKTIIVNKNDLGVYHYIWSCDTFNQETHSLKYDVYVKLKAIEVYEDLVEIEVIDIKINESASQDVINLIKSSFPTYVNSRHIKWQIK